MFFRVVIILLALTGVYLLYEIYHFSMLNHAVMRPAPRFVVQEPKNDLADETPVRVVEFFDYRCGFCRQMHRTIGELINLRPDITYIPRPFAVMGEKSDHLARIALAAGLQDAFYEFHNAFLAVPEDQDIDDSLVRELVTLYNLDYDRLIADSQSEEITKALAQNEKDSVTGGIYSIPTIVINKTFIGDFDRVPTAIELSRLIEEIKKD